MRVRGLAAYRRREWLSSAGWGTVALIASLAWLMPWYVIWVLPLAALGTSLRLRRTAVVLTVFLIATFMPLAGNIFYGNGINPLNTQGRARLLRAAEAPGALTPPTRRLSPDALVVLLRLPVNVAARCPGL